MGTIFYFVRDDDPLDLFEMGKLYRCADINNCYAVFGTFAPLPDREAWRELFDDGHGAREWFGGEVYDRVAKWANGRKLRITNEHDDTIYPPHDDWTPPKITGDCYRHDDLFRKKEVE